MHRDIAEAALAPPAPSGRGGRSFIAVIGIDDYATWPRLGNAVSDARGIARLFTQLGFIEVAEPLLDGQATGDAMRRLVTADLAVLTPQDSLVLFFAGHGHTHTPNLQGTSVKTGFLIPVDGARPSGVPSPTWLRIDSWLNDIARLPPVHILVIVDACHSGVALTGCNQWREAIPIGMNQYAAMQRRRSRRVIASALDDERAMDNGPVPGHSLFTGCLIEGLGGGLVQHGTQVATGREIGDYVVRRVRSYPQSSQTPDVGTFDLDDRGDILVPILDVGAATEQGSGEGAAPTQPSTMTVPMAPGPSEARAHTVRDGEEPPRQSSGRMGRVTLPRAGRRNMAGSNRTRQRRDKAWLGAGAAGIPTWFLSFGISARFTAHAADAVAVATIVTAVIVCLAFYLALAVLRAWNE